MLIILLGGAGLGLVWGWLMGNLDGQLLRSKWTKFIIYITTLLLAVEVLVLLEWRIFLVFVSMMVLSLLLHLEWQHKLRKRFS